MRQAVHLQTSTNPTHLTGTAGSAVNKTEESGTAAKTEQDAPTKTTDEDEKGGACSCVAIIVDCSERVNATIYRSTPISMWFD